MVMLEIVSTPLNGTVCTWPCRSRRRMVRMVIASTVPVWPPAVTTSPTATLSSSRMKSPVMMSFTRVCAPKPMARPATPTPASTGAMSMPISERTISAAITPTTTRSALRASGSRVRARWLRSTSSPFSSTWVR